MEKKDFTCFSQPTRLIACATQWQRLQVHQVHLNAECLAGLCVLQETGDGELVVLHDLHSVLAASAPHAINQEIIAELAGAGLLAEAPATTPTVSKYNACNKTNNRCNSSF